MTIAHDHDARTAAARNPAYDSTEPRAGVDGLNRDIAQDAMTDQELESQVPPVSRYGTTTRIAAAAVLILAGVAAIALFS